MPSRKKDFPERKQLHASRKKIFRSENSCTRAAKRFSDAKRGRRGRTVYSLFGFSICPFNTPVRSEATLSKMPCTFAGTALFGKSREEFSVLRTRRRRGRN